MSLIISYLCNKSINMTFLIIHFDPFYGFLVGEYIEKIDEYMNATLLAPINPFDLNMVNILIILYIFITYFLFFK